MPPQIILSRVIIILLSVFFTNRIKLTLYNALDIFKSVIIQSSKNEIFQNDLLVTQKLINRANKLPLNKIKEIEPHKFVYIHQNGKTLPGLII